MSNKSITRSSTIGNGKASASVTISKTSAIPSRVPLVFALIFICLLILMVVKAASGKSPVTFTSLLEFLSTIDRPFVNFAISDYSITADWGLLNGLRNFFNIFMSIFGIGVFTAKSLVNVLAFLFQVLGFILF